MSLSERESEELGDMLQAIQADSSALNAWERQFIDDQVGRFDKYGAEIFLSPKQWKKIRDIYESLTGDKAEEPEDEDDEIPF